MSVYIYLQERLTSRDPQNTAQEISVGWVEHAKPISVNLVDI